MIKILTIASSGPIWFNVCFADCFCCLRRLNWQYHCDMIRGTMRNASIASQLSIYWVNWKYSTNFLKQTKQRDDVEKNVWHVSYYVHHFIKKRKENKTNTEKTWKHINRYKADGKPLWKLYTLYYLLYRLMTFIVFTRDYGSMFVLA